jgi:hypothetical protein
MTRSFSIKSILAGILALFMSSTANAWLVYVNPDNVDCTNPFGCSVDFNSLLRGFGVKDDGSSSFNVSALVESLAFNQVNPAGNADPAINIGRPLTIVGGIELEASELIDVELIEKNGKYYASPTIHDADAVAAAIAALEYECSDTGDETACDIVQVYKDHWGHQAVFGHFVVLSEQLDDTGLLVDAIGGVCEAPDYVLDDLTSYFGVAFPYECAVVCHNKDKHADTCPPTVAQVNAMYDTPNIDPSTF